jgi:hypothetical protein
MNTGQTWKAAAKPMRVRLFGRGDKTVRVALGFTLLALAAANSAACAEQAKQFDLACNVSTHDGVRVDVYSFDLLNKQVFSRNPNVDGGFFPVTNDTPSEIVISRRDVSPNLFDPSITMIVDREGRFNRYTGEFILAMHDIKTGYSWSETGSCEARPFTPFPKSKF